MITRRFAVACCLICGLAIGAVAPAAEPALATLPRVAAADFGFSPTAPAAKNVDGIVENVTDELRQPGRPHPGSVSRLLTGAWIDWHPGIRLQNGDTVRRGDHVDRILAALVACRFEPDDRPADMPDIALSGTVSGKVFLKGTIEKRPMSLVLPEGVTTSKSAE